MLDFFMIIEALKYHNSSRDPAGKNWKQAGSWKTKAYLSCFFLHSYDKKTTTTSNKNCLRKQGDAPLSDALARTLQ